MPRDVDKMNEGYVIEKKKTPMLYYGASDIGHSISKDAYLASKAAGWLARNRNHEASCR